MNDSKPYDLELKDAAKEIKDILIKHNICGFVTLVSSTHGEFLNYVETDWTGLSIDNGEIKVKINSNELGHELADIRVSGTIHAMDVLSKVSSVNLNFSEKILELLTEEGVEYSRDYSSPYTEEVEVDSPNDTKH